MFIFSQVNVTLLYSRTTFCCRALATFGARFNETSLNSINAYFAPYLPSGKEKENGENLTVKLSTGERVRTKESLDFEIQYLSPRETIEFSVKVEV